MIQSDQEGDLWELYLPLLSWEILQYEIEDY